MENKTQTTTSDDEKSSHPLPKMQRVGKFFEGEGPIFAWQLTLTRGHNESTPEMGTPDDSPLTEDITKLESQKGFLIIDAHQETFGVRFATERPFYPKIQGALVAAYRKYATSAFLSELYVQDKNVWIPLHKSPGLPPFLWLGLIWSSPPEMHLIDDQGVSLVRKSQKGTYTKRKQLEDPTLPKWPPEGLQSINPKSLSEPSRSPSGEAKAESSLQVGIFSQEQRKARDRVARRLKTLQKSLKQRFNSDGPASDEAKLSQLQKMAWTLKTNFHLLSNLENNPHPTLEIPEEGLKIDLTPGLTPGQWTQEAYEKVRKEKKHIEFANKERMQLFQNIELFQKTLQILREKPLSFGELEQLLKPLKLRPEQATINSTEKPHGHVPYRIFKIPRGEGNKQEHSPTTVEIFVGKSAFDSDILVKKSKGHDLWLHAVGTTGSHVIIPAAKLTDSTKQGQIDDPIFFAAAVLAHYYSKNRDLLPLEEKASLLGQKPMFGGEVYFSKRQHLRKKKGMPPGLWLIEKAKTLYIKYSTSDIQWILNHLDPSGRS